MIFIGEASELSGASIKAIRHYEKIGLLPNLSRSGSYRIFSKNDVALIKLIKEASNIGFKLSEFKQIFDANVSWSWPEIDKLIRQKGTQIDEQIEDLKIKQKRLNQYSSLISDCVNHNEKCSQTPLKYLS